MFRRDPHMVQDWEEKGPQYYAPIQRDILKAAYQMLREGGYLVYSTCTFSPEEDEKIYCGFCGNFRICTFVKSHVKRAFAAESRMLH